MKTDTKRLYGEGGERIIEETLREDGTVAGAAGSRYAVGNGRHGERGAGEGGQPYRHLPFRRRSLLPPRKPVPTAKGGPAPAMDFTVKARKPIPGREGDPIPAAIPMPLRKPAPAVKEETPDRPKTIQVPRQEGGYTREDRPEAWHDRRPSCQTHKLDPRAALYVDRILKIAGQATVAAAEGTVRTATARLRETAAQGQGGRDHLPRQERR